MNSITAKQNEQDQIERLAAQRHLYSTAKQIFGFQLIFGGPVAFIWALLVFLQPETKGYAALWAITLSLADIFWLTPWQKRLRENAAKIQEAFDCDVLQLPWNEIKVGKRVDPELVKEQFDKFVNMSSTSSSPLTNWYPTIVSELPLEVARVVCQRSNCWWDSQQRRRYAFWIISIVLFVTVFIFSLGFIGDMTIEKLLLAILLPLSPALILGIRQYSEQTEAANRLDKLKDHAERIWFEALNTEPATKLETKSRALQDEIFENRKRSPLVFDWIFYRLRDKYQAQMNCGAEDLTKEAKRKLGLF